MAMFGLDVSCKRRSVILDDGISSDEVISCGGVVGVRFGLAKKR